jgi:hypothetical protein
VHYSPKIYRESTAFVLGVRIYSILTWAVRLVCPRIAVVDAAVTPRWHRSMPSYRLMRSAFELGGTRHALHFESEIHKHVLGLQNNGESEDCGDGPER